MAERIVVKARARMATDAAWRRRVEEERRKGRDFSLVLAFALVFVSILMLVASWCAD